VQRIKSISTSIADRAAMAAAAFFTAGGIVEIIHSQRNTGSRVAGVSGHLSLGFFAAALFALAPVLIALAARTNSGRALKAGLAAATAVVVLALASTASLIHGHDYGFFNAVAAVTNGAWLVGSIVVAVALMRSARLARPLAIGLPLAWIAIIPLATLGGGVLAGAYFVALACVLISEQVESSTRPIAA
jgi:hypothetical protein